MRRCSYPDLVLGHLTLGVAEDITPASSDRRLLRGDVINVSGTFDVRLDDRFASLDLGRAAIHNDWRRGKCHVTIT